MTIGENLKRVRIEKGMTQKELAKAVNVGQPMVAQIERGTKQLTLMLCEQIAEALGINVVTLVGELFEKSA